MAEAKNLYFGTIQPDADVATEVQYVGAALAEAGIPAWDSLATLQAEVHEDFVGKVRFFKVTVEEVTQ